MLEKTLKETTKLKLSPLKSKKHKESILVKTKEKIDNQISSELSNEPGKLSVFENSKESCWESALKNADKEFKNTPEKLKLNSFYLQEVFQNYVENIIQYINHTED